MHPQQPYGHRQSPYQPPQAYQQLPIAGIVLAALPTTGRHLAAAKSLRAARQAAPVYARQPYGWQPYPQQPYAQVPYPQQPVYPQQGYPPQPEALRQY